MKGDKPTPKQAQSALERLLEDVRTGAIFDRDELSDLEMALLKQNLSAEEFEAFLDEWRNGDDRDQPA